MGGMSSLSSADTAAASTEATDGDAQQLLDRIHATLMAAFQRHARDGGGLRALSMDDIAPLRTLCDQLLPAHFKLHVPEPAANRSPRGRRNRVRYQHISGNQLFSMGIFILPPGSSIPLHDHPDMSVISRVLYGRLHATSCDLVSPKEADHLFRPRSRSSSPKSQGPSDTSSGKPIARIFQDVVITAPHTTALLPDEGNLHEFVADAELGCAIFDILTPPYDEDGRDCTYYRIMSDTKTSENGCKYVELEEFEPLDFEVVSEPYHGPRLVAVSS